MNTARLSLLFFIAKTMVVLFHLSARGSATAAGNWNLDLLTVKGLAILLSPIKTYQFLFRFYLNEVRLVFGQVVYDFHMVSFQLFLTEQLTFMRSTKQSSQDL